MRIHWNNAKKQSTDMCHAAAGYFCPHCGSEIFAEWFYSRNCEWGIVSKEEYKIYQNMKLESSKFASLLKCPFCDGSFNDSKEYFIQAYLSPCTKEDFFPIKNNIVSNTEIIKDIAKTDAEWSELISAITNSEKMLESALSHYEKPTLITHPLVTSQLDLYSKISATLIDESKKKNIVLLDVDGMFDKIKLLCLTFEKNQGRDLTERKIEQLTAIDSSVSFENPNVIISIKTEPKKLQEFLLQIINIEKNIIAVKQRMCILYSTRLELNRKAKFAQLYPVMSQKKEITEKIDGLQAEFRVKANDISELKSRKDILCAESVVVPQVTMPIQPLEPIKPIYATANIFNKKKVAAENEAKSEKYNVEMALYNKALAEYPVLLEAAKKQQEELREKAVQERNRDILELEKKIEEKTIALEKFKNEIEAQQESLENKLSLLQNNTDYPAVQLKINIDGEITTVENTLLSLFKQKNQLYATDIIFGKYRDLAAITSFYEYLLSGRCETLDGINGCYNLYESELRANIIINKLDTIGDSLELIKGNQYMLYSQLSQINTELSALNSTTTAMVNGIRDAAEVFLEHSAVIAHNSAASAYYAKLNAEIASSDRYISMICW